MDLKSTEAALTTKTYDRNEIDASTGNIYESISIMARRAVQINEDIKAELFEKLEEFATPTENLEEIFEGVTSVLVQGDTTSAFSIALASAKSEALFSCS